MNKGIEILLERMKSNPDEFVPEYEGGSTKWNAVMSTYRNFLAKDELEAFDKAQRETVFTAMQERFTQRVMKELLDPKSEDGVTLTSISHPTGTQLGGATQGGYSLTANGNGQVAWSNATGQTSINANSLQLGSATLNETALHQLLHMKAQMELERQKQKEAQAKKHETLVGKLYNYLGSNK